MMKDVKASVVKSTFTVDCMPVYQHSFQELDIGNTCKMTAGLIIVSRSTGRQLRTKPQLN
jgi:hypothetical protein